MSPLLLLSLVVVMTLQLNYVDSYVTVPQFIYKKCIKSGPKSYPKPSALQRNRVFSIIAVNLHSNAPDTPEDSDEQDDSHDDSEPTLIFDLDSLTPSNFGDENTDESSKLSMKDMFSSQQQWGEVSKKRNEEGESTTNE